MALLPSIGPAEIPVRVKFSMFFDRAGVAAGISKAKRAGLYKAGSVVMQIARRSIEKKGLAKPKLKVMTQNPDASLGDLLRLQEAMIRSSTSKREKMQEERIRQKIRDRIFEIKFRPASKAPKPPHTHLGTLRNSIVYGYDSSTESVVVGGFMAGIPRIVSLHEFGGSQKMAPWAWVPDNGGRGYTGIIGWWPVGREPHMHRNRWTPLQKMKPRHFIYPARPYMRPALEKGISSGRIAAAFGNSVTMTGRPGT
ncbi:MAG: hypothetical protein EBR82_50175 [Caulobacteraceae bacterium]|nr:hypothetical protein [Caulobacteraceae bacterium]